MLTPGFANPVLESQACFRAILNAMARPGVVHSVSTMLEPPAPLDRAMAAVLLTLADGETPLWLDPAGEAAAEWLAFHCGAPRVALPAATIAVALSPVELDMLEAGSDEMPERGATLVLQVHALERGLTLRLEGPGLAACSTLAVDGLSPDFVMEWAANHARFPRGIDLILCAGDRLAAFPRTLSVGAG